VIKIIKTRFFPNLGSGCIRMVKPCACILKDAYTSFSTNS